MHVCECEMGSTTRGGARDKNRIIMLSWSKADMLEHVGAGVGGGTWCRSTGWVRREPRFDWLPKGCYASPCLVRLDGRSFEKNTFLVNYSRVFTFENDVYTRLA